MPGSNAPKTPDWGATQANIKLPGNEDFSGNADSYGSGGGNNDYGATTPYFRLPEEERLKYQNVPLTPTQEAAKQQEEAKQKGGIPSWVWVSGGLAVMFVFTIVVLLAAWFFLLRKAGYEATIVNAPLDSKVIINGSFWGTTAPDGSIKLTNLKAGESKKIEIKHPNWLCQEETVKSDDGVNPPPISAKCKQVAKTSNECVNIKAGAFDIAEKCANKALDELPNEFSVDQLLAAMNLYIIQFDKGKYDIPARNMVFLERAAGYMKKLPPNIVVEVGGHTDSDGSDELNQTLSENRAKAVKDALVQFGIKPEALTEKGYGETKPKDTNDNDDGKFRNRRIEYTAVK
ncbi:MAG: OmpA family protein, partial [Acidobacteriota bacterium]|nr:OmpA family protein [Acidobacteriota bacterium]